MLLGGLSTTTPLLQLSNNPVKLVYLFRQD